MRNKPAIYVFTTMLLAMFASVALAQAPLGTAFTYQGQLQKSGAPLNAAADFRFILYDADVGGSQVGSTLTVTNVLVDNGLFTVWLDFGSSVFAGNARWLEIGVRSPAGGGSYTTLSPRQELTATPYALYARSGSSTALQGRPVSTAAPGSGQVLEWNGSTWTPATDNDTTYTAGTGLTQAGSQFALDLAYADNRYVNAGQTAGGDLTGSYPNPMIATNAVTTIKIADGSVGSADLAADAVTSAKIADNSVSTADLATGAVTSVKIADGSVALADMASNSVDSTKIVDGGVGTNDLASSAVTSAKIADNSVSTADLAAGAVTSDTIANGAVIFNKLSNPLDIGATNWAWDLTTGYIDIDITANYPAMHIESTSTGFGDCLYLRSNAAAGSATWVLYTRTLNGIAGYFVKSTDDDAYAVYIQSPTTSSEGLYVYGNTVATGTKSAAIETSQGPQAIFSVESPEVEVYASGDGVLANGSAYVPFDALFTEAVSPDIEVRVTVTPVGGWSALYLDSTGPEGFLVVSAGGQRDVRFHWMASGRRLGYEERPHIAIPDPVEEEAVRLAKEAEMAGR